MAEERRRAIIYINEQEIASLLRLPDDVRVMAVASDFPRMAIGVIIEGDSLAPTEPGTVLPEYRDSNGGRYLPRFKEWSDGYREGLQNAWRQPQEDAPAE